MGVLFLGSGDMAYTKIFAIRVRLDDRVAYVTNVDKIKQLGEMIEYSANGEKTEEHLFETAFNCQSTKTAFQEMMDTKVRWNKPDGVLGYHIIQSFAPGEVTPEQAHKIGKELFEELFADKYEGVIATHLDRQHLHNHIVINSVSFVTGKKYHSSHDSYFNGIRKQSDDLCKKYGLSVIQPKQNGRSYPEWQAEQSGRPTIRSMIKRDADEVIKYAKNWDDFLSKLEKIGYVVKRNRKHIAVKHPSAERFVRLDSIGYTPKKVEQKIYEFTRYGVQRRKKPPVHYHKYPYRGNLRKRRKYTGFVALYFRYVYLLKGVKHDKQQRKVSRFLTQDVIRMEQYAAQFRVLVKYKIQTSEELMRCQEQLKAEIEQQINQRKEQQHDAEQNKENIEQINNALRQLRKDVRLLSKVREASPQMQERLREIQQSQAEQQRMRKEKQDERRQPSSRSGYQRSSTIDRGSS